jgi:hypothetical protein
LAESKTAFQFHRRFALDDALDMLIILQDIAERDIDDQQTGT